MFIDFYFKRVETALIRDFIFSSFKDTSPFLKDLNSINVLIVFHYVTFAEDTRFAEMFRQPVGGQFFMDGNRMSGNQMIQGQMVGGQMVGGQMVGGQMVGTQSVAGLRTIKKSKLVYYFKSVFV